MTNSSGSQVQVWKREPVQSSEKEHSEILQKNGRPCALSAATTYASGEQAHMPSTHTRCDKKRHTKTAAKRLRIRVTTSDSSAEYQAEARLTLPRIQKPGHKNSECSKKRTAKKPRIRATTPDSSAEYQAEARLTASETTEAWLQEPRVQQHPTTDGHPIKQRAARSKAPPRPSDPRPHGTRQQQAS